MEDILNFSRLCRNRLLSAFLVLFVILTAQLFAEPRYISLKEGGIVTGEISQLPDGFFLSDGYRAALVPFENQIAVYEEQHYRKIADSTPFLAAARCSIGFCGGEEYVWYQGASEDWYLSNWFWLPVKAVTLIYTVDAYNRQQQAANQLSTAITGVSDSLPRKRFQSAQRDFLIGTTLFSTVLVAHFSIVFHRFGTDDSGNSLGIDQFRPLTPSEIYHSDEHKNIYLQLKWNY